MSRATALLCTGAAICAIALAIPSGKLSAVDGDTIHDGRGLVRLIGLNTAEMKSHCWKEYYLSRAAQKELAIRLMFQKAELEFEPCGTRNFGRRCAKLLLDGHDWAITAVRRGLAEPYHCVPGIGCPKRRNWCT